MALSIVDGVPSPRQSTVDSIVDDAESAIYNAITPRGLVEAAVLHDLDMALLKRSGLATLGELALVLARAIDATGSDDPMLTARLVRELRAVMVSAGAKGGGNDEAREFAAYMSAPVRHGAQPGPADTGPAGR